MKGKILALVLAALMALALLTGCGGGQPPAQSPAGSASEAQEPEAPAAEASVAAESAAASSAVESAAEAPAAAASTSAAPEAAQSAAEGPVSPYAWQGLQDMPQCAYLDTLCTYHYYREYTGYVMSFKQEKIEAMDGVNSFKNEDSRRTYSVDGHIIAFNDSSKTYMEYDMGESLVEMARESMEEAMAQGTNTPGRSFVGTGTGAIPVYCDTEGDQTEYEYYEYDYPATLEATGYQMVERFYMKDGDVYAVYQEMSKDDEQVTASTEVIKSMSGEIPEGTFDVPSKDGYEELKLGDD